MSKISAVSANSEYGDPAAVAALRKRAAEFEGILLAQILEKVSEAYRVPGADDADSAGESLHSLATSALGNGLAASGGVGIAEMLVRSLKSSPGR